jgi:hypothetical protein
MKSSFKKILSSIPAIVVLILMVVVLTSCPGAKPGSDSIKPEVATAPYPLILALKIDTSGNQTPPHFVVNTQIPAGTQVFIVCSKDCVQAADASGNAGGPKIFFQGTLSQDIPANTELALRLVSASGNVK